MSNFELPLKATQDLKQIARDTQMRWGREKRISYLGKIDQTFKLLAAQPLMGVRCDWLSPPCHKFFVSSHVIYYDFSDVEGIFVLRILHKSMDIDDAPSHPNNR